MSFLEEWNSVRSAFFARLMLAGLSPASPRLGIHSRADTGAASAAI